MSHAALPRTSSKGGAILAATRDQNACNMKTFKKHIRCVRHWVAMICAATAIPQAVNAQMLEAAHVLAEPLQYSRAGNFRGCGLHLRFVREVERSHYDYLTLSVNFWLDSPAGMTKTVLSSVTSGPEMKAANLALASAWTRIKPSDTLPAISTYEGEEDSVLSTVPLDEALAFVLAVLERPAEVQVGFKQKGLPFERIFYGKPVLSSEASSQMMDCLGEFLDRLEAQSKQGKPN